MRRKCVRWVGVSPIIFGATNAALAAAGIQNALYSSDNWAGYFATPGTGQTFTDISSTWVVPAVQPPNSGTTYSGNWVGFDGLSDTTVEQCGTAADVSSDGTTSYFAWYEFAPATEVEISSVTVHPGDTISAEVTYEPSQSSSGNYAYFFEVNDQTDGQSFMNTIFTSSNDARSSAEWIEEAPTVNGSQSTLANFGSTTFSNDVAALNGGSDQALSALSNNEIEMKPGNDVIALPTSIGSGGETFSINYTGTPANLTWNNHGGADLGDGATWDIGANDNWNNGTITTIYTNGSNVTFNDTNNTHYAVALNVTVKPGSVNVNNNSGNYTISGTGHIAGTGSLTKSGADSLTLSTVNSYTGGTNVTAGTLIAGVTGAIPDEPVNITGGTLQLAQSTGLAQVTSLSISGSGKFDVYNNHVIINYSGSDPIASIAAWIKSGYASGAWNGTGIMSTAAQSNSASYGIGYADSADPGNPAGLPAGQIKIMYTLLGDANLDGKVNGTDFNILAANFNTGGDSWDQGDFNYDGKVNGTDFNLLAANFNQGATQSSDLAALDSFAVANGLATDVPEPGCATFALVAALGFLPARLRVRKCQRL